jgi:hypothetical protein
VLVHCRVGVSRSATVTVRSLFLLIFCFEWTLTVYHCFSRLLM